MEKYIKFLDIKLLILVCILVCTVGCASIEPYKHTPSLNDAILTVYRNNEYLMNGVGAQIKIDNQLIAILYGGEYCKIKLSNGKRKFSTNGVGYGGEDRELLINAEANSEQFIEVKADPAMWWKSITPIVSIVTNPIVFVAGNISITKILKNDSKYKEIPIWYIGQNKPTPSREDENQDGF